jgi:hypothetical protein
MMAETHFLSMEAPQNKSDVTIQFLVGGLVITSPEFPSVLFRSKVIQKFHAFAAVKNFFNFWGQI